jgi:hypothetical protein
MRSIDNAIQRDTVDRKRTYTPTPPDPSNSAPGPSNSTSTSTAAAHGMYTRNNFRPNDDDDDLAYIYGRRRRFASIEPGCTLL